MSQVKTLDRRGVAPALRTPSDLPGETAEAVAAALNPVIADTFALFVKTKNFHWHISGPHFRDYHLLLDEQATQLFASIDELAERIRKTGGTTLRSIGHIARLQRLKDNDEEFVSPVEMLRELMEDNQALAAGLRQSHDVANKYRDVGTTSLLETLIDQAERRTWFLYEANRAPDPSGH